MQKEIVFPCRGTTIMSKVWYTGVSIPVFDAGRSNTESPHFLRRTIAAFNATQLEFLIRNRNSC